MRCSRSAGEGGQAAISVARSDGGLGRADNWKARRSTVGRKKVSWANIESTSEPDVLDEFVTEARRGPSGYQASRGFSRPWQLPVRVLRRNVGDPLWQAVIMDDDGP